MPGRAVQVQVADVRRDHRLIAVVELRLPQPAFQRVAQDRAIRLPERQALAHQRAEREQIQPLADDAVIALAGFFEQVDIVLELLRRLPSRAVDARQLLALLVAAPVGTRRFLVRDAERVGVDLARVIDVRTPAQIRERILRVERDLVGGLGDLLAVFVHPPRYQIADQFLLIRLVLEVCQRFVRRHFADGKAVIAANDFFHPVLDPLQILVRRRVRQVEIVVEAIFNRRTDGDFRLREAL